MLPYLLATVVGLASFGLYIAGFFFPEIHRRYDLLWSGVGMFYAVVLWVCANGITGGLLLGQIASVALLGWLGYQTLQLRYTQTPLPQRTPLPAATAVEVMQITWQNLRSSFRQSAERSPLAARLDHWIDRSIEIWQAGRSRLYALISTTFNASVPNFPGRPDLKPDARWNAEADPPPEQRDP